MASEYTQLGISGLTLAILFFIVRYFVAALNTKDTYLENNNLRTVALIKEFQVHVELCNTNFMKNSVGTSKSLDRLSRVLEANTLVLRKNMEAGTANTAARTKGTISSDLNTAAIDQNTGALVKNGNGK